MGISQTTVRFLKGVPFDNSYAHTRWFNTRTEQYKYFTSFPSIQRTQNNFQKSTGRMAIDVSEHVHTMMGYDYLMYQNDEYSNKWFYGFILNVEHISRKTTRVYFEVDPIQTYMFDVDIKQSQVVREHEHSNPDNVYPEGLQVGNEYRVVKTWDIKPYPFYFMVFVTKAPVHEASVPTSGTKNGITDPLNYYFIPISRNTENSTRYYGDDRYGQSDYLFGTSLESIALTEWMENSQHAVNNVVSVYLTDYLPIDTLRLQGGHYRFNDSELVTLKQDGEPFALTAFIIEDIDSPTYDFPDLQKRVGNAFKAINESEPKLRYSPYTIIEVTDSRGNVVNYKPEGFLNRNGELDVRIFGGITHQNTVAYGLHDYFGKKDRAGVLDNALINTDPQDLAVLNNQTTAYLQGAKNSMQAKRNTWSSQQLFQEMGASNRMATSAGNLLGGSVGLGMSALNLGYGINMLSTGMGNLVQSGLDHMQAGQDYQNRINEQNAVVEDLNNIPPSLQKQGNNPSFSIGYNLQGVRVRIKRVLPQYLNRVRDYLHMFGTKTNRLKTPNLRTRTHFNYIQTTMLNIQSDYYNDDILRFKYIFEQGITLWHTNDLYNYNVSNNRR